MQPLRKNWQIHPAITPEAEQALNAYPPVLRQLLFNRDIHTPEAATRYLQALDAAWHRAGESAFHA